jgi:hypothetical protein
MCDGSMQRGDTMQILKESFWKIKGPYVIDESVTVRGRDYVLKATEPYINKHGGKSNLLHWCGNCNTCGATFSFVTSQSRFKPLATCEAHRQMEKASA